MKKILFVSDTGKIIGGGEFSLLSLMAGLLEKKYDVQLLLPEGGDLLEKVKDLGVDVEVEKHLKLKNPINLFCLPFKILKLRSYMIRNKFTVVHSNSTGGFPLMTAFAAQLSSIPFVWHVRTVDKNHLLDFLMIMLSIRVLAISEYVLKTRLKKEQNRKYRVVYNAIEHDKFSENNLRQVKQTVRLGTLGRFVELKGYEHLIALARVLREQGLLFKMRIVGIDYGSQNKYLQSLQDEIIKNELNEYVTLEARVDNVSNFLGEIDIFLFSSKSDAFGRVLIEAMSSLLPVVSFDKGAVCEIIENGVNGFIVQYSDIEKMAEVIQDLCKNKKLYESIALAGQRSVRERFCTNKLISTLEKVYEEIRS